MLDRPSFTLFTAVSGADALVTLGGPLDVITAPGLDRALGRALDRLREPAPPRLVLDVAGVEFLDAAAARVIFTAAQAWPGPHPVVIRDPSPIVRRLLQLCDLPAAVRLEEATPGLLTQITTPAGGKRR
jgi:anti-anti-sigma factor